MVDVKKIVIKRIKRRKKVITGKEKALAALGLGSSLISGGGAVAGSAKNQTQIVRNVDGVSGQNAKQQISKVFGKGIVSDSASSIKAGQKTPEKKAGFLNAVKNLFTIPTAKASYDEDGNFIDDASMEPATIDSADTGTADAADAGGIDTSGSLTDINTDQTTTVDYSTTTDNAETTTSSTDVAASDGSSASAEEPVTGLTDGGGASKITVQSAQPATSILGNTDNNPEDTSTTPPVVTNLQNVNVANAQGQQMTTATGGQAVSYSYSPITNANGQTTGFNVSLDGGQTSQPLSINQVQSQLQSLLANPNLSSDPNLQKQADALSNLYYGQVYNNVGATVVTSSGEQVIDNSVNSSTYAANNLNDGAVVQNAAYQLMNKNSQLTLPQAMALARAQIAAGLNATSYAGGQVVNGPNGQPAYVVNQVGGNYEVSLLDPSGNVSDTKVFTGSFVNAQGQGTTPAQQTAQAQSLMNNFLSDNGLPTTGDDSSGGAGGGNGGGGQVTGLPSTGSQNMTAPSSSGNVNYNMVFGANGVTVSANGVSQAFSSIDDLRTFLVNPSGNNAGNQQFLVAAYDAYYHMPAATAPGGQTAVTPLTGSSYQVFYDNSGNKGAYFGEVGGEVYLEAGSQHLYLVTRDASGAIASTTDITNSSSINPLTIRAITQVLSSSFSGQVGASQVTLTSAITGYNRPQTYNLISEIFKTTGTTQTPAASAPHWDTEGVSQVYNSSLHPYSLNTVQSGGTTLYSVSVAMPDGQIVNSPLWTATQINDFLTKSWVNADAFLNLRPQDQAVFTAFIQSSSQNPQFVGTSNLPPANTAETETITYIDSSGVVRSLTQPRSPQGMITQAQANLLAAMFPGATVTLMQTANFGTVTGTTTPGYQVNANGETRNYYEINIPGQGSILGGLLWQQYTTYGTANNNPLGINNIRGFSTSAANSAVQTYNTSANTPGGFESQQQAGYIPPVGGSGAGGATGATTLALTGVSFKDSQGRVVNSVTYDSIGNASYVANFAGTGLTTSTIFDVKGTDPDGQTFTNLNWQVGQTKLHQFTSSTVRPGRWTITDIRISGGTWVHLSSAVSINVNAYQAGNPGSSLININTQNFTEIKDVTGVVDGEIRVWREAVVGSQGSTYDGKSLVVYNDAIYDDQGNDVTDNFSNSQEIIATASSATPAHAYYISGTGAYIQLDELPVIRANIQVLQNSDGTVTASTNDGNGNNYELTLDSQGAQTGTQGMPGVVLNLLSLAIKNSNLTPTGGGEVVTPSITTSTLPNATVGTLYSQTLTGTNLNGATWSATGLPAGLTLSETGILSGTSTENGEFTIVVTVGGISKTLTLTVNASNAQGNTFFITTDTLSRTTLGQQDYIQTLRTTGGSADGNDTWSLAEGSNLPGSLRLLPTGELLWENVDVAGSFTFTIKVTDSAGQTVSKEYTLVVDEILDGVSQSRLQEIIDQSNTLPYDSNTLKGQEFTALSNYLHAHPNTFAEKNFAQFSPNSIMAFMLDSMGTEVSPQAQALGFVRFDADLGMFVKTPAPVVASAVTIAPANLDDGKVGANYNYEFKASGGSGSYQWTANNLPEGLNISADGKLTGTPTAAGNFTFTVTATDTDGKTASADFTINISAAAEQAPLVISEVVLSKAMASRAYDPVTFKSEGGQGQIIWSAQNLPDGLQISSEGVLEGTISDNLKAGDYSFTVTATNSANKSVSKDFSITVVRNLTISTASLINLNGQGETLGGSYSAIIAATGGTLPVSWQITNGSLPDGLKLSITAGSNQLSSTTSRSIGLRGVPTKAGTFKFTVQVTDADNKTATATYIITIEDPTGAGNSGQVASGVNINPYGQDNAVALVVISDDSDNQHFEFSVNNKRYQINGDQYLNMDGQAISEQELATVQAAIAKAGAPSTYPSIHLNADGSLTITYKNSNITNTPAGLKIADDYKNKRAYDGSLITLPQISEQEAYGQGNTIGFVIVKEPAGDKVHYEFTLDGVRYAVSNLNQSKEGLTMDVTLAKGGEVSPEDAKKVKDFYIKNIDSQLFVDPLSYIFSIAPTIDLTGTSPKVTMWDMADITSTPGGQRILNDYTNAVPYGTVSGNNIGGQLNVNRIRTGPVTITSQIGLTNQTRISDQTVILSAQGYDAKTNSSSDTITPGQYLVLTGHFNSANNIVSIGDKTYSAEFKAITPSANTPNDSQLTVLLDANIQPGKYNVQVASGDYTTNTFEITIAAPLAAAGNNNLNFTPQGAPALTTLSVGQNTRPLTMADVQISTAEDGSLTAQYGNNALTNVQIINDNTGKTVAVTGMTAKGSAVILDAPLLSSRVFQDSNNKNFVVNYFGSSAVMVYNNQVVSITQNTSAGNKFDVKTLTSEGVWQNFYGLPSGVLSVVTAYLTPIIYDGTGSGIGSLIYSGSDIKIYWTGNSYRVDAGVYSNIANAKIINDGNNNPVFVQGNAALHNLIQVERGKASYVIYDEGYPVGGGGLQKTAYFYNYNTQLLFSIKNPQITYATDGQILTVSGMDNSGNRQSVNFGQGSQNQISVDNKYTFVPTANSASQPTFTVIYNGQIIDTVNEAGRQAYTFANSGSYSNFKIVNLSGSQVLGLWNDENGNSNYQAFNINGKISQDQQIQLSALQILPSGQVNGDQVLQAAIKAQGILTSVLQNKDSGMYLASINGFVFGPGGSADFVENLYRMGGVDPGQINFDGVYINPGLTASFIANINNVGLQNLSDSDKATLQLLVDSGYLDQAAFNQGNLVLTARGNQGVLLADADSKSMVDLLYHEALHRDFFTDPEFHDAVVKEYKNLTPYQQLMGTIILQDWGGGSYNFTTPDTGQPGYENLITELYSYNQAQSKMDVTQFNATNFKDFQSAIQYINDSLMTYYRQAGASQAILNETINYGVYGDMAVIKAGDHFYYLHLQNGNISFDTNSGQFLAFQMEIPAGGRLQADGTQPVGSVAHYQANGVSFASTKGEDGKWTLSGMDMPGASIVDGLVFVKSPDGQTLGIGGVDNDGNYVFISQDGAHTLTTQQMTTNDGKEISVVSVKDNSGRIFLQFESPGLQVLRERGDTFDIKTLEGLLSMNGDTITGLSGTILNPVKIGSNGAVPANAVKDEAGNYYVSTGDTIKMPLGNWGGQWDVSRNNLTGEMTQVLYDSNGNKVLTIDSNGAHFGDNLFAGMGWIADPSKQGPASEDPWNVKIPQIGLSQFQQLWVNNGGSIVDFYGG